jgi:RNA polymerase sigma-70 factor (ECF subfamily)
MNQTIEPTVVAAFRNGDQSAFREVFNVWYKPLYYFVNKLIESKEEAEEIVQNSFIKLFERCALFETAANIKAFLFVTARNNSFDYLRSLKVQKEKQQAFFEAMQDEAFFQYEYEIKDELVEMVRAAIEELPEECRRVFKMLYYEELSPAEVAEILNITVSTVYNQKSRAVKALRITLAEHPLVIAWLLFTTGCMKDVFSVPVSSI